MKLSFVAHDFIVACRLGKQRIEAYAFMVMTRHDPTSSVSSSTAGLLNHEHNANCQTVMNRRLYCAKKFAALKPEAVRCYEDPQITMSPW
jgi:hypothetical protein